MTDQNEQTSQPPTDAVSIADLTMRGAVSYTIRALNVAGEMGPSDVAVARLALEVAERIDAEGLDCYVSLYARLFDALADLRHTGATVSKQVASKLVSEAESEIVRRE